MKLMKTEVAALNFLASCGGGFTAGAIARNVGCGHNRRTMAVFRTMELARLFAAELIDKIDAEKPAVYVITNAGRRALAEHGGAGGDRTR